MKVETIQIEQPQAGEGAAATPVETTTTTVETTAAATESTPATEQPTTTDYSWLEKHNIKSENDLTALFTARQELEQQLEQAKQQPPVNPYKTDFAKVADELASKGVKPETIARFHGLNVETLDAKNRILMKLEIESPELTAKEREDYFNAKYGITEENDSILTDGEKALRKVELQKEGAIASDFLKQYIYQAFNPNQVDPALLQKETERQSFWSQQGVGKVNAINEVKVPTTIKLPTATGSVEEKAIDFVYQIPQEGKQLLMKQFNDTVLNPAYANVFDNSENGINAANQLYNNLLWQNFGNEIIKQQAEHTKGVVNQIHEHYSKLMNNTSFNSVSTDTQADKSVSPDKGLAGFLRKGR